MEIKQKTIDSTIDIINCLTVEQMELVINKLNKEDMGGFAMFLDSTNKESYINLLYEDYAYVRDYIKILKWASKK